MDANVKETSKTRLAYLDNVRSLVIFLVIAMHTAVTYSGIGDWYYKEGSLEALSMPEKVFFAFGQSFLQAWFMGILFFISAYWASKALAKRGPLNFIKERLFRLGIPLLIYVFIISPVIGYILHDYIPEIGLAHNYVLYITSFNWVGDTGPLWFVEALLIFCFVYALLKKLFPQSIKMNNAGSKKIIFAIILTGIMAFLIRLVFPIDTSFYNLQFCYFASYIVMFIAGILIGENDLLEKIADVQNVKWIGITLLIGVPIWVFIIICGGVLDDIYYFKGGLYWQSCAYALWESLTAIGFSVGLIAAFRKKANIANKWSDLLRNNAFAVYFFHAPILVSISLVLRQLVLIPIIKFAVVTIITFGICLVFSILVRKIKPVGMVLK